MLWSGWRTVQDRLLQLSGLRSGSLATLHERYLAVVSILITCIYFISPFLWFEAARAADNLNALSAPLMVRGWRGVQEGRELSSSRADRAAAMLDTTPYVCTIILK